MLSEKRTSISNQRPLAILLALLLPRASHAAERRIGRFLLGSLRRVASLAEDAGFHRRVLVAEQLVQLGIILDWMHRVSR